MTITASTGGEEEVPVTDGNGQFAARLASGKYVVMVDKAGFSWARQEVTPRADRAAQANFAPTADSTDAYVSSLNCGGN